MSRGGATEEYTVRLQSAALQSQLDYGSLRTDHQPCRVAVPQCFMVRQCARSEWFQIGVRACRGKRSFG